MASPRHPATILLCDDDEGVMVVTALVLSRAGYRVLEALDAEQALEQARTAAHIDLLVTDLSMPGMGGDQLARVLRQSNPHLKVLLVTGFAHDESVDGPPSDVLEKPFSPSTLLARVRKLIPPQQSEQA